MSNNLNWAGNRGLDPGASRQVPRDSYPFPPDSMPMYPSPLTEQPSNKTQPATQNAPSSPQDRMQQPMLPMQQPMQQSLSGPMQPSLSGLMQQDPEGMPERSDLPEIQQGPPPSTERGYIPYFLASNIGKSVRAEFIIGSNQYVDKTGILSEVGINYFVLQDPSLQTYTMCDLYSVKFVTFLRQ